MHDGHQHREGGDVSAPVGIRRGDERREYRARRADEHGQQRTDTAQGEEPAMRIRPPTPSRRPAGIQDEAAQDHLQRRRRQGDHQVAADDAADQRPGAERGDLLAGDALSHDEVARQVGAELDRAVQRNHRRRRKDGRHHPENQHAAAEPGDDAERGGEEGEDREADEPRRRDARYTGEQIQHVETPITVAANPRVGWVANLAHPWWISRAFPRRAGCRMTVAFE